ncbi:MAG: hypothetical protein JSU75_08565 [Gammaproteobacteria bacterium]|nr:MAG: hypothetical protein JSU75_08565 [Gammaproteobacteria bacterium]
MNTANQTQGIRGQLSNSLHAFVTFLIVVLAGVSCAPHSYEIRSAEVSPEQYKELSCAEIEAEMNSHLRNLEELGRSIDKAADKDETQTGVGLILFWPVLFWLEGSDTPEAQEYAQIRGEMLALEHTAILKDCEEAKVLAEEWREEEKQMRAAMEEKKKEQQKQHTFGEE